MAARVSCKVGERRVYSSVMNCSFNNPKSSRFFPRLHDEEEWNNGLNCMGDTGGDIREYSVRTVLERRE